MKKTLVYITIIVSIISIFCFNSVYASNESDDEIISNETKGQLVAMTDKELKSIKDYQEAYGSDVYGTVGYILNKVRVYSIPIAFLVLAVSAIYQFVSGARNVEKRDKGFNMMIGAVTVFVICQILPLVFAIVVKGWK